MLSFAGDIPGLGGVGEGSGSGVSTRAEVRADLTVVAAPPANAKVLSDKPATHASAHVRTATFLKDCLGIVPSSGTGLNIRHALARKCLGTNIQSARRT